MASLFCGLVIFTWAARNRRPPCRRVCRCSRPPSRRPWPCSGQRSSARPGSQRWPGPCTSSWNRLHSHEDDLLPLASSPAVVPGGEPVPPGVPQGVLVAVPGEPVGLTPGALGVTNLRYKWMNLCGWELICLFRDDRNVFSVSLDDHWPMFILNISSLFLTRAPLCSHWAGDTAGVARHGSSSERLQCYNVHIWRRPASPSWGAVMLPWPHIFYLLWSYVMFSFTSQITVPTAIPGPALIHTQNQAHIFKSLSSHNNNKIGFDPK